MTTPSPVIRTRLRVTPRGRRENSYLRKMLEAQSHEDDHGNEPEQGGF